MEKPSHFSNALKWGGIMGIALVIVSLLLYLTGLSDPKSGSTLIGTLLSYIISIGALVMGIKAYKVLNGGYLSIGEGIIQGILIGIVGGLIAGIYTIVFMQFIDPEMMEQAIEQSMEQSEGNEQAEAMISFFTSPIFIGAMAVIMKFFLGLFVGLITGAIIKEEKPFIETEE